MKHQWAVEITIELLDGSGVVEGAEVQVHPCNSEREARIRNQANNDAISNPERRHPKYQRLAGSKLVRRPVGAWEEVA